MRKRQDEILTISLRDRKAKEEILNTQKNSLKAVIEEKRARQDARCCHKIRKRNRKQQLKNLNMLLLKNFITKSENKLKKKIVKSTKDLGTSSDVMEKHWENMSTEHLADISNEMLKQTPTLKDEQMKAIFRYKS